MHNQNKVENRIDQTVINLCGLPATGKTRLLKTFADEKPGILQIISPNSHGAVFDPSVADFDGHNAVAIDEVGTWERTSIIEGIAALKKQIVDTDKRLILVTQRRQDLSRFGIQSASNPTVVELQRNHVKTGLHFDGRSIRFVVPVSTLLASATVGGAGVSLPPQIHIPKGKGAILLFVPIEQLDRMEPLEIQRDLCLPWHAEDMKDGVWFEEMISKKGETE